MFKTAVQTLRSNWLIAAVSLAIVSLPAARHTIRPVQAATDRSTDPATTPAADAASPKPASTTTSSPATTPLYGAHIPITGPTTAFHDSVASHYNYAFGKESPFLPSNATSSDGQFMSPKAFPTAEYCGHCHQEAYRQWRESVHSNSFRAPWYLKNVNAAHRREGRPVLPPLRRLPQPCRPALRRPVAGHAQKAPLRAGRRHLLHLPLHRLH